MKWLQFIKPAKSLDFREAEAYMGDHDDTAYTLLDVRQPSEYAADHIPGALLIPLPELGDRMSELDKKKPVLVY